MKTPEKVSAKLYITMGISGYHAGQISIMDFDRTKHAPGEHILLKVVDFETSLDKDLDVPAKVISGLEAEIEKKKADHFVEIKTIKDRISELKAICYKGD